MNHSFRALAIACATASLASVATAGPLNIHVETVLSGPTAFDYPPVQTPIPVTGGGGGGGSIGGGGGGGGGGFTGVIPGSAQARQDAANYFRDGQRIAFDITLDDQVTGVSKQPSVWAFSGAVLKFQATVQDTGETFNLPSLAQLSNAVYLSVNTSTNSASLRFATNSSGNGPYLMSDTNAAAPALYLITGGLGLSSLALPAQGFQPDQLSSLAQAVLNAPGTFSSSELVILGASLECHPTSGYCASGRLTTNSFSVSGVPEASTWSLMGLGLMGLVAVRRRQAHQG
jgi:PEP-CTERM motif